LLKTHPVSRTTSSPLDIRSETRPAAFHGIS